MPKLRRIAASRSVFLNIPYDEQFEPLYVAYIVGLYQLGLQPRVTLEITGGERRLNRILTLIRSCRYSIHDLSRVELDHNPPFPTPRFNMPFELGLAVAAKDLADPKHKWFLFETVARRVEKSLTDLNGTDANIHGGTVQGVMSELCNAFVKANRQPTVPQMIAAYEEVIPTVPALAERAGTGIFSPRVFEDLCVASNAVAQDAV